VSRRGRRASRELPGSLFPFLSVLACVIGTLTLLITALAIERITGDAEREDRFAYEALVSRLREAKEAILALDDRIGRVREAKARATDLASVQAKLASLESEYARALEVLEERRKQAEELKNRPETEPRIVVQPSGRGRYRLPFFVECTSDSLIVHRAGQSFTVPILREELMQRFGRFLRAAKSRPGVMVIFLIRPDGVELYDRASQMAEAVGIRHGKLPIPGNGELDLHYFEES
jgi:hypothetical protein